MGAGEVEGRFALVAGVLSPLVLLNWAEAPTVEVVLLEIHMQVLHLKLSVHHKTM